jgi:hypothetical protein
MGVNSIASGRNPSILKIKTRLAWKDGTGVNVGLKVCVGLGVKVTVGMVVAVGGTTCHGWQADENRNIKNNETIRLNFIINNSNSILLIC